MVCIGTGILFKEPNPNREPPKRPNWAIKLEGETEKMGV